MKFSKASSARIPKHRCILRLYIESRRRFDAVIKSCKLSPAVKDVQDNSEFPLY